MPDSKKRRTSLDPRSEPGCARRRPPPRWRLLAGEEGPLAVSSQESVRSSSLYGLYRLCVSRPRHKRPPSKPAFRPGVGARLAGAWLDTGTLSSIVRVFHARRLDRDPLERAELVELWRDRQARRKSADCDAGRDRRNFARSSPGRWPRCEPDAYWFGRCLRRHCLCDSPRATKARRSRLLDVCLQGFSHGTRGEVALWCNPANAGPVANCRRGRNDGFARPWASTFAGRPRTDASIRTVVACPQGISASSTCDAPRRPGRDGRPDS